MRWSLLGCETMVPSLKIGPIPKKEIHLLSLFRGKLLLSSMDWERGVRVGQAVVSAVGEILHRCRAGFRFQASQIHPPYPRNRKPFWIHGWLVRSLVQYLKFYRSRCSVFFRQSFFFGWNIEETHYKWLGKGNCRCFFPGSFFFDTLALRRHSFQNRCNIASFKVMYQRWHLAAGGFLSHVVAVQKERCLRSTLPWA